MNIAAKYENAPPLHLRFSASSIVKQQDRFIATRSDFEPQRINNKILEKNNC